MKDDEIRYKFLSLLLEKAEQSVLCHTILNMQYIMGEIPKNTLAKPRKKSVSLYQYTDNKALFLKFLITGSNFPPVIRKTALEFFKYMGLCYYSYVDMDSKLYYANIIKDQIANFRDNKFFYYIKNEQLKIVTFLKGNASPIVNTFKVKYTPPEVKIILDDTSDPEILPYGSVLFEKIHSLKRTKSYTNVHKKIVELYINNKLTHEPCAWCYPVYKGKLSFPNKSLKRKCIKCSFMIEDLIEYMKNNNIEYANLNDVTKVLKSEYKDISGFRYKKIEKLLKHISDKKFQRKSDMYEYLKSDAEECKIIRQYYPILK